MQGSIIPDEAEILLVEDNQNDVELTLRSQKDRGHESSIHIVQSGEEALEFLWGTGRYAGRNVNFLPKVIFLDLNLPKMSGLEVLKKIKTDERTKTIPVVMVSLSTEPRDIEESYALGANSYVQKPLDFEGLTETISQARRYWLATNKRHH